MTDIYRNIIEFNTDKYLQFLFCHKAFTRAKKKANVIKHMESNRCDKTIANYRIWIDYVFNKTKYWREPATDEREYFEDWRNMDFKEIQERYNNELDRGFTAENIVKQEFENKIIDELCESHFDAVFYDVVINRMLTDDYYTLASIVGKIDFLKFLNTKKTIIRQPTIEKIALKLVYEGKFVTRQNAKEFLVGTTHKSGDALYNCFMEWSDNGYRKADPDGKDSLLLKNKIKKFEEVSEMLSEDKRAKIKDEIVILQSFLKRYPDSDKD